ncbi:alpha/beta hydrolase [Capsulimonas corticalis]|uniref:Alpha/beta hydrolase n=1 Tax=Capsulimonas corticalis TaxID=2219043 RepID=A0A402CSB9_9BACT|nr:alpha/beta fold hydrolase [Capsulimonas corticalis]BDI28327.1 alpha/beta hydrolase [Capsulimonas corticalis]
MAQSAGVGHSGGALASAITLIFLTSTLAFAQIPAALAVDAERAYTTALPLYKYDARQPLAAKFGTTTHFPGGRVVTLTYRSVNDVRVPALLYLPDKATKVAPAACLVLLHGLGGNKESLAPLGQLAAASGYVSLIIDEYGHGERAPKKADGTPAAPQFTMDMIGGGRQTVLDVRRGIDLLTLRPDVDPKRVGLMGFSLGALIGSVAAGVEPRIKATVLVSGGGDLAGILKALSERDAVVGGRSMAQWKGMDWNMTRILLQSEEPVNFAAHIAPRAVLMECGRLDDIVPPFAAQAFYDAATKPADNHVQIDWYDNAGHIPPLPAMVPKIQAWLKTNL